MPKCGICGGDAPKQPFITEDGNCDLCERKVVLEEEKNAGKTPGLFTSYRNQVDFFPTEMIELYHN